MSNLREVMLARKVNVREYEHFSKGISVRLRTLAAPLRGKCVIHVNATEVGGGVAELLMGQVPFERALGLRSYWYAIRAPGEFFKVTKKIHNLLQGKSGSLTENNKRMYLEVCHDLGISLSRIAAARKPAVIVLHDPQPLAAIGAVAGKFPVVSRLHGDLLTPNAEMMEFARPFLAKASRVVLSSADYEKCMPWLTPAAMSVIYPAIDPLAEKNRSIEVAAARRILEEFGVHPTDPLAVQVSRFDPWKDPMGVIQAYYIAKNRMPNLQLALLGLMLAKDDPEAVDVFRKVQKHAKGDRDIFLFADPRKVRSVPNELLVGAMYAAADVVMQKSIREGFGLTMTEAMWKGKPLIAGRTTGALIQVKNGKNGVLVSSPEEAGKALARLLRNPALRRKLGAAARESVRRRFLLPRFVADNLKLYRRILKISS